MDGTIITANENFLKTMGYSLAEIQGKHHSMFVEPAMRESAEYREFWAKLNRGEYSAAEYKRIGKGGKEVWILASYNPILDERKKPFKVVKFATDVTEQKLSTANLAGQIAAIGKSQAVIEFNMDGTIITANENFLGAMGYTLDEIRGRHHSMFVESSEREGAGYREFWARLNRGEYQAAEYKRIGKGGKEVWIQASYNPILDLNNKPYKVVKYATDVTQQVLVRMGNERVRSMMDSVAAGAEELNASVREISEAMVKSKETASDAVQRVENADGQAKRLSSAAEVDERDRRDHWRHYGADQSARAQRHDRIRAGGRSRPRLCRRGRRSQKPGQSGETGHRQDHARDRIAQWNFRRGRGRAQLHQAGHPERQRVCDVDRGGGRRTEHRHQRNVVEHATCCCRGCKHRAACGMTACAASLPRRHIPGAPL